jgi:hypothetical protein
MTYWSFDLSVAFAKFSMKDGPFAPLVRSLRNLEASLAIRKDLEEAKEAIDAAGSISQPIEGPKYVMIEALFVHALMLYCRATHSGTKVRNRIDVIGGFTPEQKLAHKEITSLRDTVIAHYGTGESQSGGPWIKDHVVFHRDYFEFKFSYPQMRAATKGKVTSALYDLIQASHQRMLDYGTAKQHELAASIRAAMDRDKQFLELVERHPFSEEVFFGMARPPGPSSRFIVPAGTKLSDSHDES